MKWLTILLMLVFVLSLNRTMRGLLYGLVYVALVVGSSSFVWLIISLVMYGR